MREFAEIWSYLAASPLIWLTATLIAYVIGDTLAQATGRAPLANPVLIAVILLASLLWITGTSYATYFEGAQFVHFLLGPATVALAIPLWQQRHAVRRAFVPICAALLAGSVTAVLSALAIGHALGLSPQLLATLAPKSTTAPVALGISQSLGGSPTLTAVLVILTGMIGAIVVTPLMNALRIRDWRARGFAVGVAAHGIGTARAFQVNPQAGAFAGIGMALNAMLTALLAPWALGLFL
ncbi:LrgB family protein [Roseinatronobacter bogoriensis]|uniref:LrgB family protein n=1 Tax=Roseinatronobacter bogoriensis subsp. barguzinensis TaxID=441209 RepID=A0A2K8KBQ9_9RHOB|nr:MULTISPECIES: LrgB family protein [Rhodobaca]ATX66872.1 LrgB family protein [Rhodobaca barguzinensis]MBB4206348.1 putative murein hydrolase (TIGR00659 family) [Rhodobaca bogoriensis DSM 18756]TDW41093.1 putative murein hydrolase (TIGR00659 family) [Rhodobaca barguzinensis]TDY74729.1 putative murein hydrolase (TIGR00659 family) [Rhodobaca bogoriensis DSM 18756]